MERVEGGKGARIANGDNWVESDHFSVGCVPAKAGTQSGSVGLDMRRMSKDRPGDDPAPRSPSREHNVNGNKWGESRRANFYESTA